MIASLDDAMHWYQCVRSVSIVAQCLAKKHWDVLPWDGDLGRDEGLKHVESKELMDGAQAVLSDLNDLAVSLLFSVFEATLRARVKAEVEAELPRLRHPAIQHAVSTMQEALEHGSFSKILEPYKPHDESLVEENNQVRRYRNWVAHGKGGPRPEAVEPRVAHDRLSRFLEWLDQLADAAATT